MAIRVPKPTDGLFVDGVLIPDAFEPLVVNPAANVYSAFTINLPSFIFAALADGSATVRIDFNSRGGTLLQFHATEPVLLDYSKLEITTEPSAVPIPPALPLFAGGLGLMGWLARRRKTADCQKRTCQFRYASGKPDCTRSRA